MSDAFWICCASLLALASIQGTVLLFPWEKFKKKPSDELRQRVDELEYQAAIDRRTLDDRLRYFDAQIDEMKAARTRYLQERGT